MFFDAFALERGGVDGGGRMGGSKEDDEGALPPRPLEQTKNNVGAH